jgi:hypothetical protein
MESYISQATLMLITYIKAGLVPMMTGKPGIGKSDMIKQIAADFNLKVIDLRLSQCDPTDLNGFPKLNGDRASYAAMDTFPLEGDPIPEGYVGWLLFLDEFNGATEAVQKASYKIVLDKMVGQRHLHSKVAIVCAGNNETDNALVEPMSTALQSRLVHIDLESNYEEWLDWAATHQIDPSITSFIKFKPGILHNFDPDHSDKTFACPRTWSFVDKVLKTAAPNDPNMLRLIAGCIAEGAAREFVSHRKMFASIPTVIEILASPDLIAVPIEPSIIYAMCSSMAHHATDKNFSTLMRYIVRFPKEFQIVCLRETTKRNITLAAHPVMNKWYAETGEEVFN